MMQPNFFKSKNILASMADELSDKLREVGMHVAKQDYFGKCLTIVQRAGIRLEQIDDVDYTEQAFEGSGININVYMGKSHLDDTKSKTIVTVSKMVPELFSNQTRLEHLFEIGDIADNASTHPLNPVIFRERSNEAYEITKYIPGPWEQVVNRLYAQITSQPSETDKTHLKNQFALTE
jgi:hypothetical protein